MKNYWLSKKKKESFDLNPEILNDIVKLQNNFEITIKGLLFLGLIINIIIVYIFISLGSKIGIFIGIGFTIFFTIIFLIGIKFDIYSISFDENDFIIERFTTNERYSYSDIVNLDISFNSIKRYDFVKITLKNSSTFTLKTSLPLELFFSIKSNQLYNLTKQKLSISKIFKTLSNNHQEEIRAIFLIRNRYNENILNNKIESISPN